VKVQYHLWRPHKKAKPYIASQLDHYFVRDRRYIVIHHSATAMAVTPNLTDITEEKAAWRMAWDIIL